MGRRDLVPAGRRPVAQCQRVSSQSVPHARAPAWSCERRRHAAGPEQEREPEASEGAAGCDFACVASRTSSLMGKTCHTVLSRMERSWWVAVRVAVAVADARFLPRSSPHCPGHAKRAMWNAFPGSEERCGTDLFAAVEKFSTHRTHLFTLILLKSRSKKHLRIFQRARSEGTLCAKSVGGSVRQPCASVFCVFGWCHQRSSCTSSSLSSADPWGPGHLTSTRYGVW